MQSAPNSPYILTAKFPNAKTFIKETEYGGSFYQYTHTRRAIHRGHSRSETYKLIPSILRDENFQCVWPSENVPHEIWEYEFIQGECNMLFKFFKECDLHGLYVPEIKHLRSQIAISKTMDDYIRILREHKVWLYEELYELAALAQHYGLSTRLLDWTYDFKVALYFATCSLLGKKNLEGDLEIWTLDVDHVQESLLDKVKIIRPRYQDNSYICAQQGLFTLWPVEYDDAKKIIVNRTTLDELIVKEAIARNIVAKPILIRFLLPKSEARALFDYLNDHGYNGAKIFPDYTGVIKGIRENGQLHPMAIKTDIDENKFAIDYHIYR